MAIEVLIVDDLPFMRAVIRDIVKRAGFAVAGEAVNGRQGVGLYRSRKPDVVLLDITMPVMDGITALKHIMITDPAARVIMCSALGQQRLIIRSIQIGAKDFITKPFSAERIVSAIKKAVGAEGFSSRGLS